MTQDARSIRSPCPGFPRPAAARLAVAALLLGLAAGPLALADQPFAPDRQYDLQHVRIELRFDTAQKKVFGQVTHTLSALREGLRELDFDSVQLAIQSAQVNGAAAPFTTTAEKLRVTLARPSRAGERYEVTIRYEGTPRKGLYFVLPDTSNPDQPPQIWTQGQAEDTRYYIPIYDYPNDKTTTEMILTVPANWITVSNGTLAGVRDASAGAKTWTWRQDEPISTYLISLVAGEFDGAKETWRNLPVEYYVPRGRGNRIEPTFSRTRDMLTFFSDRFGVMYPWAKYAQTMVDQFVIGGMENVSATTLTTRSAIHPELAAERLEGSDGLIAHELGHQWFGDLVTCKDWTHLWLNEGFATLAADLWQEHRYGADALAYSRWRDQAAWRRQQRRLFEVPIVNRNFRDSLDYAGNIYGKAGLVLGMLRRQLGDAAFFPALRHYLEANRYGNVVTADLVRALEESTNVNVDRFFDQWVYGAGAPRLTVTSAYDSAARKLTLTVKQTQRQSPRVGLFEFPVEIVVATDRSKNTYPVIVSKAEETFTFTTDGEPRMVLFDKGSQILKFLDFQKSPEEWIYQLRNAEDVPDRADAAQALGRVRDNDAAVAALGEAALRDPFWGVRAEALRALGAIGGDAARERIVAALANAEPWVREVAVEQLGGFRGEAVATRLAELSRGDRAWRVRAAALSSLAQAKAANALATLEAALATDSPDETIRRAALRAMGRLGDSKAVPTLLEWSAPGRPAALRAAAISSLGQIEKRNADVTARLIGYLQDENFDIRYATLYALGERGDQAAIAPLEALLKRNDLPVNFAPTIERQIARIRNPNAENGDEAAPAAPAAEAPASRDVLERLDRLEQGLAEANERLKRIEQGLSAR